jgi:uncharacterized protein (TIGR02246 family)
MKTENTPDIAAVKQLSEDYAAAWAKGDPELLLSCYADDAVVIMSDEDPIVGKEALRELYEHLFAAEKTEEEGGGMAAMAEAIGLDPEDYTFTTEGDEGETEVSGELGYLWSTYASVATPKPGVDGTPIRDSGVSLIIVRRQKDGAWKLFDGLALALEFINRRVMSRAFTAADRLPPGCDDSGVRRSARPAIRGTRSESEKSRRFCVRESLDTALAFLCMP